MKKLVYLFVSIFVLLVAAENVNAQNATASADASATIIQVIGIQKAQGGDLQFGNIIADADGGTVTIDNEGTPTYTGINYPSIQGEVRQAAFTVSGMEDVTYNVTLPSSTTLSSGGNNMTVNSFTSNPDGTGTLTGGTQTLNIGATLNVAASQPSGEYKGEFSVTVAYN